MKTSYLLFLVLILLGSALPAMAQYPVEEVGPLLDITKIIQADTDIINTKTTDMDLKLTQVEQLMQQNIQPDIETMRKIQVNQADVAMQLDKLASLQQRGQILVSGTTTGSTSGTGTSVPVAGYNWNQATQTAQGLGGGFAGNYVSPQFSLPFGTMSQIPQAIFPIQSSALSGLVSVASNYATQALGIGGTGAGVTTFSGGAGINSAIGSAVSQVFGNTGFNLNSQVGATALNGAMMVADDAFIRPAQGTNGSVDAAYAQLVNGGFGQVMQGTPTNAFTFLAASNLSGSTQNYSPAVGTYSSATNLINSILTNGASSSSPAAAAAYANFNQIASLVAANPSQYLVGGTKLSISNTDVSNFLTAQQNGTAPSASLSQYSLSDIVRKSSTYVVGNFTPDHLFHFAQAASSNTAVLSAGPSMGTAGQLQSSFGAANNRLSALDLTKTTTQQYILYTQQILQNTLQIEQGLEQLVQSLSASQKNAIPQIAQMQTQVQDQIKVLQDKLQSLNSASTQLDQQLYGQLQNYDTAYAAAVKEAAQRAPLIAHAASVEAEAAGNPSATGTSSSSYYDPLYGKRFELVHVAGQPGLVLALR